MNRLIISCNRLWFKIHLQVIGQFHRKFRRLKMLQWPQRSLVTVCITAEEASATTALSGDGVYNSCEVALFWHFEWEILKKITVRLLSSVHYTIVQSCTENNIGVMCWLLYCHWIPVVYGGGADNNVLKLVVGDRQKHRILLLLYGLNYGLVLMWHNISKHCKTSYRVAVCHLVLLWKVGLRHLNS